MREVIIFLSLQWNKIGALKVTFNTWQRHLYLKNNLFATIRIARLGFRKQKTAIDAPLNHTGPSYRGSFEKKTHNFNNPTSWSQFYQQPEDTIFMSCFIIII